MGWFQEQLESASREVESWPEWRKEIMLAVVRRGAKGYSTWDRGWVDTRPASAAGRTALRAQGEG